jgi:hypothetical protein
VKSENTDDLDAKQDPVAWRYMICPPHWTYSDRFPNKEFAGDAWDRWQVTPLYTAPPKREWVDLTEEQIFEIWVKSPAETEDRFAFVKAVIAALKEKNT